MTYQLIHNVKRTIALVGDLHCGSALAVCPPRFLSQYDFEIHASEGQRQIWDSWLKFCDICNHFKVDMIIVLGDILDGSNRKRPGKWRILTDLDDQKEVAIATLQHLVNPNQNGRRKLMALSGSDYHTSQDVNCERDIIKKVFGGEHFGGLGTIDIIGTNRSINIRHEMTSAQIYDAMVLQRIGFFQKVAEADGVVDRADILAAGHLHKFLHIHGYNQHLLLVPGWKAFEPWAPLTKGYPKTMPQIGGCILFIDDSDRIIVHHYLYPVPHIADKTVTM